MISFLYDKTTSLVCSILASTMVATLAALAITEDSASLASSRAHQLLAFFCLLLTGLTFAPFGRNGLFSMYLSMLLVVIAAIPSYGILPIWMKIFAAVLAISVMVTAVNGKRCSHHNDRKH
jgi:hypothetical protein